MTHQERNYAAHIRRRGYRVTPQREMILDAICEGGGHSSAEEIYGRVQAKAPAVNQATVYRTLDFLHKLGLIVAAEIGGRTVYEIAGETPHHHLVCRACGYTLQIDHDAVGALFAQIEREQKFKVETNHLALHGLCEPCAGAEEDQHR